MPLQLVTDLRLMINDYYKRFPPSESGTSVPQTPAQSVLPRSFQTPSYISPGTSQHPQNLDVESEREEGELEEASENSEWEDYQIQTPSPPPPDPVDSPPVDIGGFHLIMERATKRFMINMETKTKKLSFLYDFRNQQRKQVRTVPIIDFIWKEGLKIMMHPSSMPAVLPGLEKKYKAPDNSPACLIGQPKPDSIISQAAQRRARNPSVPVTTPPDRDGRKLDTIGKKVSTIAATTVRVANSLAILG